MAELSVEISARIDKLQKELAKAKGEFNSLEKSAQKTNSKLGKSTSSSAKGIDKLGKSAISGNSAMTAFSRTVQDAPFGRINCFICSIPSLFIYLIFLPTW